MRLIGVGFTIYARFESKCSQKGFGSLGKDLWSQFCADGLHVFSVLFLFVSECGWINIDPFLFGML